MTQEELAQLSKQIWSCIFESGELTLNDLPGLADWMKVISVLDAEISSLKLRLEEIKTRLSTLEAGLAKPM